MLLIGEQRMFEVLAAQLWMSLIEGFINNKKLAGRSSPISKGSGTIEFDEDIINLVSLLKDMTSDSYLTLVLLRVALVSVLKQVYCFPLIGKVKVIVPIMSPRA